MSDWPRIVDEQYRGDPFLKLVECGDKFYVVNETDLIAQEEATYRAFEEGDATQARF
jgi:dUTPase